MAAAGDPNRRELSLTTPLLRWTLRATGVLALVAEGLAEPWLGGAMLAIAAVVAASRRAFAWGMAAAALAALLFIRDAAAPGAEPRFVDTGPRLTQRFLDLEATLTKDVAAARTAIDDTAEPTRLFDQLAAIPLPPRHGLSVYGAGEVRAWSGRNSTLPGTAVGPGLRVIEVPGGAVVTLGAETAAGLVVAEAPLAAIAPIRNLRVDVARRPAGDTAPPESARAITALSGRDGAVVVEVSTPTAFRLERRPLLQAVVGFALAAWLVALATSAGRAGSAMVAGTLLVAARLAIPSTPLAELGSLFGHSTVAVATPFGLFASAGDLMMTGLLAAALAGLCSRLPRPKGAGAGFVLLVLAAAGSAAGMIGYKHLIDRVADNSDLDLAQFALVPFEPARLAVVLGLTLIPLAVVFVGATTTRRALQAVSPGGEWSQFGGAALASLAIGIGAWVVGTDRSVGACLALPIYALPFLLAAIDDRTWRRRAPSIIALSTLAIALVQLVLCQRATERSLHRFIQHDVAESIRRQDANVRWLLESVLDELEGPLGDSIAFREPEEQAYLVWSRTQLQRESLRSAVDVRATDGRFGRFSFRLPIPATIGTLLPGDLAVQEMQFQGRELHVLAGARRLADGARVTVRIGEDSRGIRFFPDVHHLIEVLKPSRVPHLEPLSRFEVELMVVDREGRVAHSSSPRVLPVSRKHASRAQDSTAPFWWTTRVDGRDYDALTFAAFDHVLTLSVPLPSWSERIAGLVHVAILLAVIVGLTFLVVAAAVPSIRTLNPGLGWIRRSYDRKATLGFAAGAIAPALLFSLYLSSTIETQSLEAVRTQSVRSLEFARRVLAEFAAADPLAAIDDSTLIWVSQTVGHDLALYRDASLEATSMRELFREGLLSERPDAGSYRSVMLDGAPVHVRARQTDERVNYEASTRIGSDGLLTLFTVPTPSIVGRAAEERSRLLFLATVGLVLAAALLARVVARQTTRPVRALTEATARVAAGDFAVRIESQRHDEIQTLVESFNRMAETLSVQSAELRGRAAYLSRLLENATTGVVSIDDRGTIDTVNAAARSLLGVDLEVGNRLATSLTAAALGPLVAALPGDRRTELELELPNGGAGARMARVVVLALPSAAAERPGRLILLEEVTELVKSKKLEAWAEMARRVAHEIKNPLTPIQFAAEHLQRVWRDGGKDFDSVLGSCVSTILRQVHDMRRIVREFSSYAAGPRPVELVETDVSSWLTELVEPYLAAPRPGVSLTVAPCGDCGLQPMDASRMRRAAINLIENALAAVPNGGKVRVTARRSTDGELVIEVSDDGFGIPEELRQRIFEPYFSTRDTGTGLGLANAKRTAEDHGGRIELAHGTDRGTTMRLVLPAPRNAPP